MTWSTGSKCVVARRPGGPTGGRGDEPQRLAQPGEPVLFRPVVEVVPLEVLRIATVGFHGRQGDEGERDVGRAGREHIRQLVGRSSYRVAP